MWDGCDKWDKWDKRDGERIVNSELGTSCKLAPAGGNYFRIEDTNISGKNKYLDLEGNIPNNKTLENGKQKGRTNDKYQKITHFNIE